MIVVSDECYRCGDCVKACPVRGTITMVLPGRVRVNSLSCIGCNQCIPVCRTGCITNDSPGPQPTTNVLKALKAEDSTDVVIMDTPQKKKRRR